MNKYQLQKAIPYNEINQQYPESRSNFFSALKSTIFDAIFSHYHTSHFHIDSEIFLTGT